MNKLIKECAFGDMTFNIATNREIALKVSQKFPDEVAEIIGNANDTEFDKDNIKEMIKDGKLADFFSRGETALKTNDKIARFALPLMLKEAGDTHNAKEIIDYAIENDADQILFANVTRVVFMGFTMSGEIKTPKIQFTMD